MISRILDVARAFILAVALGIALGAVIAPLDSLSVASVPILGLAVVLAFASARRRLLSVRTAATLAAGLLVAPLAAPEIAGRLGQLRPERSAAEHGLTLKVVTLNIMDGNPEKDAVAAFLRAERPDIIILQEARGDMLDLLRRTMPEYQTRVTCRFHPYCGLAIISRWPGTLLEHGYWADEGLSGEARHDPLLRYASVTLRVADAIDVDVGGVHISRNGRLTFDRPQLAQMANLVAALPHQRHAIVAGDFNTAAPSHALARFDRDIGPRRRTYMFASWPANRTVAGLEIAPLIGIDQMYAGSDWRLTRIRRGPNVGSDHAPLIAEFALRD